jgi:hypothetical protein
MTLGRMAATDFCAVAKKIKIRIDAKPLRLSCSGAFRSTVIPENPQS